MWSCFGLVVWTAFWMRGTVSECEFSVRIIGSAYCDVCMYVYMYVGHSEKGDEPLGCI